MSGLVYKDLLAFIRKTRKLTWFMEVGFFLFFILGIESPVSVFTFCLLVVPVNASGMATTLKEIDLNCNSARFHLTLPFSHRELVLARFLSTFSVHIVYVIESLFFCAIRYFIYDDFPFSTYLVISAGGVLIGICMTALNLLSSFSTNLNTSAILYLVIIALFTAIYLIFLFSDLDMEKLLQLNTALFLSAGAALTVAIVLISYITSIKIYTKKLG